MWRTSARYLEDPLSASAIRERQTRQEAKGNISQYGNAGESGPSIEVPSDGPQAQGGRRVAKVQDQKVPLPNQAMLSADGDLQATLFVL